LVISYVIYVTYFVDGVDADVSVDLIAIKDDISVQVSEGTALECMHWGG